MSRLALSTSIVLLVIISGVPLAQIMGKSAGLAAPPATESEDNTVSPIEATVATLNVRNDALLFLEGNDELIADPAKADFWDDHSINDISSVWLDANQVEILFDEMHEEQIDDIRSTLATLYPGSDLIVDIGSIALDVSAELATGET